MTADLRKTLDGRSVVVSISGGKDSAATSLYLTELGIEHDRVFADTGWEHQLTYEYVRGILTEKLGPIIEVRAPLSMVELIRKKGIFPSRVIRFCTTELKFNVIKAYLASRDDDYISVVGIRRAESPARREALEWEWSEDLDCEVWRPLVEWTKQDVIAIHRRHGLPLNPLYLMGASRVGCWPCINASKKEIALIARTDPGRITLIRDLEAELLIRSDASLAARGETRKKQPPRFFTLRPDGKTHVRTPIDDVVAWANSDEPEPPTLFGDGCMRWGMCEPRDEVEGTHEV